MPSQFLLLAAILGQPTGRWIAPLDAPSTEPPSWIWLPAAGEPARGDAPAGPAWFWREFDLPEPPESATLFLAADNHAIAYLNGEEVLRSDDWSSPMMAPVRPRAGRNTLAVHAINDPGNPGGNPAGLIASLRVSMPGGRTLSVLSDAMWSASPTGWPGFPGDPADAGLARARIVGAVGTAPWGLSAAAFAESRPCPILRKSFRIDDPVSGRVRIAGLGHYALTVNGEPADDTLINQAWTSYDRMILWREFDISGLLRPGENVLAVRLGNSFWRVEAPNHPRRFAKTDAMPDHSQGRAHLLWLEGSVRTGRGEEVPLTSDESWTWTDGPLTFSHIYAGEDFDARLEPAGWDRPGFDDGAWRGVEAVAAPEGTLARQSSPPIRAFEVFEPTEIVEPEPGVFTYTFPQNCSALLRFTVDGPRGATIRFKPCEYRDPAGRVRFTYTWGTGKDIWQDYTLRGGGPEAHQTLFCYAGAQHVEVTGAVPEGRPNPGGLPVVRSLRLVHVRADCPPVGEFGCDSALQNRAHHLIDWSIRSNMSHVPTDCPHREKAGWQEQNWHMARAISYRYDIRDWFAKVAMDLRDAQQPDGHIPTNCPNVLVGVPPHGFWNNAPEWGIAGVLVPWHLYEWYGDRDTLAASFDSMGRYIDYLGSQAKDGIIRSNLGDWYDFGHGQGDGPSRWTPTEVSATAMWAIGARTVADAAAVLGRPGDEARYRELYARIGEDFRRHFYTREAGVKNLGSCQAGNAVALAAGLVPERDREHLLDAIADDLRARDWQQTTGEVLHIFLIRELAESRHRDVLHKVYAREDRGSYGYMVNSGLSTLPESWDAKPGTGNSMNHFMLGQLMEWHFAYIAGIRRPAGAVGWSRVLIAPQPGPLEHASARFVSPAGPIGSSWHRRDGVFTLRIELPGGVQGEALLPDGSRHAIAGPGEIVLSCPG